MQAIHFSDTSEATVRKVLDLMDVKIKPSEHGYFERYVDIVAHTQCIHIDKTHIVSNDNTIKVGQILVREGKRLTVVDQHQLKPKCSLGKAIALTSKYFHKLNLHESTTDLPVGFKLKASIEGFGLIRVVTSPELYVQLHDTNGVEVHRLYSADLKMIHEASMRDTEHFGLEDILEPEESSLLERIKLKSNNFSVNRELYIITEHSDSFIEGTIYFNEPHGASRHLGSVAELHELYQSRRPEIKPKESKPKRDVITFALHLH